MQIRKQQRDTENTWEQKKQLSIRQKKDQGRDALSSILGIAMFHVFLNKDMKATPPLPSPQKPEQLKSTDDKIIYSWSKPEKTGKNSRWTMQGQAKGQIKSTADQ